MSFPGVRVLAFELLGRHVLERAQNRTFFRERPLLGGDLRILVRSGPAGALAKAGREPKVEELDPRLREHDVTRFDVSVDDAFPVGFVEGVGHLSPVAKRLLER